MERDDPWMQASGPAASGAGAMQGAGTQGTGAAMQGAGVAMQGDGMQGGGAGAAAPGFQDAVLVAARAGGLFAVLDGAQFDDLPRALLRGGFVARSLYLDRGDNHPEQVITAPHLVWLDERGARADGRPAEAVIPALFALIGDRPAAVLWHCAAGGDELYKHLRGINMVLYPRAALAGTDAPPPAADGSGPAPDSHVRVIFRHADANVMAQTLYAMDAAELARFYGPADCLFFAPEPDWAGGRPWLQAPRPEGLPVPARGALTLSMATVGRMQGFRQACHRRRIAAYLRKVAPEQTGTMDDATLEAATAGFMAEAKSYGMRSESAMGRWGYLQLLTGGQIGRQPAVTGYLASGDAPGTADQRVRDLMRMALRAGAGG